jgi:hypothetical protein
MRGIMIWTILAAALTVSSASAQYLLPDDRAYRDIDALYLRGIDIVPAHTIKPYTYRQVAQGASRLLESGDNLSQYERLLVERLVQRVSPMTSEDNTGLPEPFIVADVNARLIATSDPIRLDQPRLLRHSATSTAPTDAVRSINTLDVVARFSDHVVAQTRLEADTDGLYDNDLNANRNKTFRLGSTGYVETAQVSYENDWAVLSFGRFPLIWGAGRNGNVVVSENAPEFDMISATLHRDWFHIQWFAAQLQHEGFTKNQPIGRFLSGQRIVLTPFDWLELGFIETINYSDEGESFSFIRSNPAALLIADEVNSNESGNGFFGLDLSIRPRRGTLLYGEIGVDDVSLDRKSPDHIAYTLGARWIAPVKRLDVGVEYTRIHRWTYSYYNNFRFQRSTNRGSVIGHFMGQDGDAVFVDAIWESVGGYRLTGLFSHRREGDTTLDTPYPKDTPTNFGYRYEKVPHGIVELTTTGGTLIETPPWRGLYVTAGVFAQSVTNRGNTHTASDLDLQARLELDWHLPVAF